MIRHLAVSRSFKYGSKALDSQISFRLVKALFFRSCGSCVGGTVELKAARPEKQQLNFMPTAEVNGPQIRKVLSTGSWVRLRWPCKSRYRHFREVYFQRIISLHARVVAAVQTTFDGGASRRRSSHHLSQRHAVKHPKHQQAKPSVTVNQMETIPTFERRYWSLTFLLRSSGRRSTRGQRRYYWLELDLRGKRHKISSVINMNTRKKSSHLTQSQ